MINKKNISKLAKLALSADGKLDKGITEYALKNLSRSELANFLRSIKRNISQNFVTVYHDDIIPSEIKREIEKNYEGKKVLFEKDENVSDGIKIVFNDTVLNLSIRGYTDNALESLKT